MGKLIRSARGELVDFDTILIKQQIAAAPAPVEVHARKEYIDIKEGVKKKTVTAKTVTAPGLQEVSEPDVIITETQSETKVEKTLEISEIDQALIDELKDLEK